MVGRGSLRTLNIRARRAGLLLAGLAAALLALALVTPPAGAVLTKVAGHGYGVTPRKGVDTAAWSRAFRASRAAAGAPAARVRNRDGLPFGGGELEPLGGPVMHSATTHVIYWDPNAEFSTTTKNIVDGFFTDVGHDSGLASSVFAIAGQYTDATGHAAYSSTFAGAQTDADAYPTSGTCSVPEEVDLGPPYTKCLFDSQLRSELSSYIAAHSLPKGPTQLYFLLLPHKVVTCFPGAECSNNVFCAYHSYISPGTANEIIYADIPFSLLDSEFAKGCQDDGHNANLQQPNPDNAGGKDSETRFADVALKYISHEYIEATTDPLVNFNTAWVDFNGLEIGDKCNGVSADPAKDGIGYDKNAFTPTLGGEAKTDNLFNQSINGGHFYIQSEWDNRGEACLMKPLALSSPAFTSTPTEGVAGEPATFEASVADPYEEPEYTWDFGDGSEGTEEFTEHTYEAPGSYEVTMTARDALTGSTSELVTHTFVVDEPPTAEFTFAPGTPAEGAPVKFDGAGSEDKDGAIATYEWEFGDGGTATGEKPEHAYAAPGLYTVTLTVNDTATHTATITHTVTVVGKPAAVTGAASGVGASSATLDATVNPHGGAVTECTFQFGTTTAYGSNAPCASLPGAGSSPVAVSAALSGLNASTLYHFRIVAKNASGSGEGADQTFTTGAAPVQPPPTLTTPPLTIVPITSTPASSAFTFAPTVNAKTGVITTTVTFADPGTLKWLLTFANGKFGVFAASVSNCKKGFVRLGGKCRPAKVVFARGSRVVSAAGKVTITIKPTAAGLKALKTALKHKNGVPVTLTLTFQSARGGSPVVHTRTVLVKLKKH